MKNVKTLTGVLLELGLNGNFYDYLRVENKENTVKFLKDLMITGKVVKKDFLCLLLDYKEKINLEISNHSKRYATQKNVHIDLEKKLEDDYIQKKNLEHLIDIVIPISIEDELLIVALSENEKYDLDEFILYLYDDYFSTKFTDDVLDKIYDYHDFSSIIDIIKNKVTWSSSQFFRSHKDNFKDDLEGLKEKEFKRRGDKLGIKFANDLLDNLC